MARDSVLSRAQEALDAKGAKEVLDLHGLPYKDAKFIVFSDFDGTITTEDSNDHLTDNLGMGVTRRKAIGADILSGKTTFRDGFREELASVATKYSVEECRQRVVSHIKLDQGFKSFHEYCESENVPVVVVSGGMEPFIRAELANLFPEKSSSIPVISNNIDYGSKGTGEKGTWSIKYRHPETGYGHDKSLATKPYKELREKTGKGPFMFFCGDGVSDLSAARAADVLFVKVVSGGTNDLSVHCQKEGIDYIPFEDFSQVEVVVREYLEGKRRLPNTLSTQLKN
ncbi:hypothetical protein BT69DRAFT_1287905 [Atractiella rhizophila]|nr:hypothetical protein BT69DRAFT_1287905 [Atractiella rhizophila]